MNKFQKLINILESSLEFKKQKKFQNVKNFKIIYLTQKLKFTDKISITKTKKF